jgi:2,4-dienoyl-CoA reductase-like NADH-dependent reductase (Old Yellow Enzyme family)/thioredoxin reductase
MQFPTLFSPLRINGMVTKNRIVATPTGDFFEDKALGGAGIVIAGHAIVEPGRSSYSSPDEPDAFFKYEVEETRRRLLKVHQAGARASIEIFHGGEFARAHEFARGPISKVRNDGLEVRGMTEADMELVLDLYAKCVRNARDLGFDMVFLHFGHGWLPAQFLSPRNNKRTDEYGGSLENRARFPLRILEAVRGAVGPDFPVDMRISAHEWVANSIDFEDVVDFIKMAEPFLDTVQISAGLDIGIEGNVHMSTTNFEEHMPNAHWAAEVRRNVSIPVGVVGAIMSPDEAEGLLADGIVDLVALGRPLIADPEWPRKAQEGRADEIVPCIRCLQCYHISSERRNVGCSVNPRFHNESFIAKTLTTTPRPKRMIVVGGGPGGISAAIAASQRGHRVTLIDKAPELGGLMRYISREHYKRDIKSYHEYLLGRVAASGIEVQLGEVATPESVAAVAPDILVLALGADPVVPRLPGIELPHVFNSNQAIERESEIGDRVVVLGSGSVGAEIGLELALLQGKHVTVVDRGTTFARRNNSLYREGLRQKIAAAPTLDFAWQSTAEEITADHVTVRGADGTTRALRADHVILALGMKPRSRQAQTYFGITPEVAMIGDCVQPRIIMDAVFEGHSYAMNV